MKIVKIAATAREHEELYKRLKKALKYLNQNYIGKTKNELNYAIKALEKIRPDLKNIEKLKLYMKQKGWKVPHEFLH
jgi:hypothetical protein